MAALLPKLLEELEKRTDAVYLSVDMDVLSPRIAPGVSHPESSGLSVTDLARFIRLCFRLCTVRAADIVEFNPLGDKSGMTAIAARDLVKEILSGFAFQKSFK
jgi:arginase family enzyme